MRTLLTIVGVLLLTSCGSNRELSHSAAPIEKTAELQMQVIEQEADDVYRIGIVILNPEELPIQSVRSWLRFDTDELAIDTLTIADDRFVLTAPGEDSVVSEEGIVKIGTAAVHPISDEALLLATFRASVRGTPDDERFVSFYNWKAAGDGHTAVLSLLDGVPVNVVQAPSSLSLQ